jgi:hypothetical protein
VVVVALALVGRYNESQREALGVVVVEGAERGERGWREGSGLSRAEIGTRGEGNGSGG